MEKKHKEINKKNCKFNKIAANSTELSRIISSIPLLKTFCFIGFGMLITHKGFHCLLFYNVEVRNDTNVITAYKKSSHKELLDNIPGKASSRMSQLAPSKPFAKHPYLPPSISPSSFLPSFLPYPEKIKMDSAFHTPSQYIMSGSGRLIAASMSSKWPKHSLA